MSEQVLESQISSVTVYRFGAYVTRVAKVAELKDERLRFVGLPLSLEDATVSCRVVAPEEEAKREAPVAADFKVALDAPGAEAEPLAADAKELKELRLDIKQLRARARVLREALSYELELGERAKNEEGHAPIGSPLEARLALLKFSDEHHRSLYEEHHAAQEKIEVAQRRLEELEVAEQRASSVGQVREEKLTKCVVVQIQGAGSEKETSIELEYFVPGACWAPAYGLRIRKDLSSAELTMRAMVSQRSGEDWKGVKLTLSTAELQRWAEVPELKSKRIGRRQQPAPQKGWRPPPPGTEELYRDYDNAFGSQPAPPPPYGAVPEPGIFGSSTRRTILADHMVADAEADYDDFGEEEHTAEILESSLPPAPVAASAPPMPQSAPMRKSAKVSLGLRKKSRSRRESSLALPAKEQAWPEERAGAAPGAYGGGGGPYGDELRADALSEGGGESAGVDEALLNYSSLRMSAAGSVHRGSLQLSSYTSIYVEYLIEQGIKVDDDFCDRLLTQAEDAYERALDIAAVPNEHTLAWAEGFDYSYEAQSRLDLLSDGQFHSVPVLVDDTDCSSQHVVVPRESTDVFRTLQLTNCFNAPLLPGPMDVYWNENFLLTSQVELTAPSGEVELGLGVDQAVKVVRNTNYREDTAGLMGGALQLTHKIAIEVANNSSREIDLEVRERVPVASSDADDIKVDVKSVSPEWKAYEPEPETAYTDALQGGYQWQILLPAGERRELSASYEIRLPSKYELRGGNRREW
jgi:hypothetical protein